MSRIAAQFPTRARALAAAKIPQAIRQEKPVATITKAASPAPAIPAAVPELIADSEVGRHGSMTLR